MAAAEGTPSVEETLGWEAERRPLAGAAAIGAAAAGLIGIVVSTLAQRDTPNVTLPEALRDAIQPGAKGLLADTAIFFHHRAASLTIGQVFSALSAPLAAIAVIYLFRATRSRRPQLGGGARIALTAGAALAAVGLILARVATDVATSDFAGSSNHTTGAAHDAIYPTANQIGSTLGALGFLVLGIGVITTSLNAMRVGLLTRFMGVLGIISGAFLVLSVLSPAFSFPVVEIFWLAALGALIWRRWPQGMPPAWETGRAEPWPSRQEMMEAREKAAPAPEPAPASEDEPGEPRPGHPRSKKKKRRK
jgi:hypothetical protein